MSLEQKPLLDWFGQEIPIPEKQKPDRNVNPCIALYGPGPDGQQCNQCAHLISLACAKTIYKCRARTDNNHSSRTDHRYRWPACAKFEQRSGDMPLYDGRG